MVDAFIKYIADEKRYSIHTLISYKTDIKQFTNYIALDFELDKPEDAISVMVRSWIVKLLESDISARSIHRKRSSLRSFYRYLNKIDYRSDNPIDKVHAPKIKQRLPEFVDEITMKELLSNEEMFDHEFFGIRDRLIITLIYACGIRLSELINIKDSDCDLHAGTIKVLGKRNKERIIPIYTNVITLIKDYQNNRRQVFDSQIPYLLRVDSGSKLYEKFVYRKVNKYLSNVTTMTKKSPHVLRHTFATHMLNHGADIYAIKEILGHASLAATQVYTHNTIEKLKKSHAQAHPRG